MPLIISVFQTADDGSGGSHQFRKSSLRKTCLNAQIMNLACNGIVGANLLQFGHSFRLARHQAAMQNFNGVAGWFVIFLVIFISPQMCVLWGLFQNSSGARWPALFPKVARGLPSRSHERSRECDNGRLAGSTSVHPSKICGTVMTNSAPCPASLITATVPWCASTMAFTKLSPRPRPRWVRLLSPR